MNHLEALLRWFLGPISRDSDSAGKGMNNNSAFLTGSQVMPMLLAWRPHFENYTASKISVCFLFTTSPRLMIHLSDQLIWVVLMDFPTSKGPIPFSDHCLRKANTTNSNSASWNDEYDGDSDDNADDDEPQLKWRLKTEIRIYRFWAY